MSTIMVTGASRGIGAELTGILTARGDRVLALVRDPAGLPEGAEAIVADLADPARLASALPAVGHLDALVHCAGISDPGPVDGIGVELWQRELNVNLVAPAELTRILLPALRSARGQVVFVNSGAGLSTGPLWAAYGASKAGLKSLADALRAEETGVVRVSTVYPGNTDTDMQRQLRAELQADYDPSRATSAATVAATIAQVLDMPADAMVVDLRMVPPNPIPHPTRMPGR
ncbi:SDR family oxidoreductase [Phytomonospora endophytica]|uniref:NAD(P)-dependent dehydrogenase (Short-subunit alcohol dehydrogenase family) n=1 Tax=Phytomonospora endophytica TaxID=714109 RepID=A0A841FC47_9ACTN|nr:SDR family oxidoreductase [Phytomonospora endophytica]MBB6032573.1 NAD(P)-dependent dehydrogenase (short-subunit alcohol dehydrogenase family) [Phytomonospora endophytica]GIG66277.1 short chain dehydrogenase [Phytomonospora endophytica]